METLTKPSRKQQLELQATTLFKSRGYAATSMRELAQILGIEAASLYAHIKSKEEILQNICFRMADAFFYAIDQISECAPELQLDAAIKAHFNVISANIDGAAVFFNEWRHLSEPHLGKFLALRTKYEAIFIEIIQRGIQRGCFRPIDEKFAMMTILSSINGTHQWYQPTGKMSVEEIGSHLSELLINGLVKINNR